MLFTDVEGSTRLARELGDSWPEVVSEHHRLVGGAIAQHGGEVERTAGDSFFALFTDPEHAVSAAAAGQRALSAHAWPEQAGDLRVRMGLHTGWVERSADELTGLDIHLAARVEAAAHGGQVVLTAATRSALRGQHEIADLGEHRLKDFPSPERLFLLVHDGRGPEEFPPLRSEPLRPTNLPADPRPLIGRERELEELWHTLTETSERLVTVLGFGGTGKTRLAIAAGAGLLSAFEGGVWLVRLAGVRDPDALLPAIGSALGLPDTGRSIRDVVVERLCSRPTLMVVDNFEQLVDAAPTLAALLDDAPPSRALVTSTLPLRVAREHVFRLEPLRHDAAVELFDRRAAAVVPGYDAGAQRGTVEAICGRVDGMPLAVELAAARIAVMAPQDLLARLDSSLAILARGPRDLAERHRSLRATMEWTFALLEPDERKLLARLAAFAGPAPLDAIESVAAVAPAVDALDSLSGLLDASLVRRTESHEHGVLFLVPQAVRDFAAEQLAASGEEHVVRAAHAAEVAERAEACRFWWPGHPDSARARVLVLEAEQRPALAWTREHDPDLHLRLASALGGIIGRSGRSREARSELATALEGRAIEGAVAGWAATMLGHLLFMLGERDDERALLDSGTAALRTAGDEALLGLALLLVGIVRGLEDDPEGALSCATEALAIARRVGEPAQLAASLMLHAQTLQFNGRLEEADAALDEADSLAPLTGDSLTGVARVRGDLAFARGDWVSAALLAAESAAQVAQMGSTDQVIEDLSVVAAALARLGDAEGAVELVTMSREISAETGDWDFDYLWAQRRAPILAAARERLSPEQTAAAEARARALPPSRYGLRAVELAQAAAAGDLHR
jgi:predicted ATPase/class 3 adenylate cyclase